MLYRFGTMESNIISKIGINRRENDCELEIVRDY
jgi:hypothetical protein